MAGKVSIQVHLLPGLVEASSLVGGVAVVIDVLRATTTMAHAFHAGVTSIYPVSEIPASLTLAEELRASGETVLLGGERQGVAVPGFDLGNSPQEYSWDRCQGCILVFTTTNGTRALLHAKQATRVLTAGFVNFSAVCETLLEESRPLHFLCAGSNGHVSLEDTLLAGAFVAALQAERDLQLNDSARLAWDTFEGHGLLIEEALRLSKGGQHLQSIGLGNDIPLCASVDRLMLVPEVRYDGKERMYLEVGSVGLERRLWPGK
ncbi:MAG TPA: 2-phosphosulfolactate phosphatase [Gemmatales bacterium]|nr:2-phosphosulfolactate phosphatase [Gemmatales bacterium]